MNYNQYFHVFLVRFWQLGKVKVCHEENKCFLHRSPQKTIIYDFFVFNISTAITFHLVSIFAVKHNSNDFVHTTQSLVEANVLDFRWFLPHHCRSFSGSNSRVSKWHANRFILHKTLAIHKTLNVRCHATQLQFPRIFKAFEAVFVTVYLRRSCLLTSCAKIQFAWTGFITQTHHL